METDLLINNIWVVICALLVFLMQAGFLCLEAGLTRSKNSINVAVKNITDFFLGGAIFFIVGYGLMYGRSNLGLFGTDQFFPVLTELNEQTFFFFQVMFAATTVTIISGAIAERVRFNAYLLITVFVVLIIYPLFGHWALATTESGAAAGWLGQLGFFDFAGGTFVHSLGGWVALALLIIIGPRTGRYGEDGSVNQIHGSNLVLSALGTLLLVFGWFGFNGGSLYVFNADVMRIMIVTGLGAAGGIVAVLLHANMFTDHISAYALMNGILVGLVAVTPGANAISPLAAILIGVVAGILMLLSTFLLDRARIDDAVGAVPVHLVGGVWGTLAVGIFGSPELIGTGLSYLNQIGVQALGIGVAAAWGFIPTLGLFFVINKLYSLRVTLEDEVAGLNITEHNASTDLVAFLNILDHQVGSGNTSVRAPVEPFTEVGQIAQRYNAVMDNLEEKQSQLTTILGNAPLALFSTDIFGKINLIEGTFFSQLNIELSHSLYAIFEKDETSKQNILAVYEGQPRDWVARIGNRFVYLRCQPKKNEVGKIDGLTGVASDITQQRESDVSRERFIDMLATSAQISEQITTILRPDELVETVLPLLKKKYRLYHAAVLLLDEDEAKLNFAFGSDERARKLKESREAITLDHPHSIIARAARRKRVVLVNDVSIEPNFLPHPLITETKAELAIPLLVHNRLIGVLDIQENIVNRFEESDVDLFVSIGRQLAIAINNAFLFEKFEESELQLTRALEKAVQSDKAKDEFLARVSHELRTPLGVILGYAEMMQDEMYGEVTDEQVERLDDIIKSSAHLTELVNQLLDSAKMDSGKIVPIFKTFEFYELIHDIYKQMDALALRKGLKFTVKYARTLPKMVYSDPMLIRQMLINLISNAVKFTDDGGITLDVVHIEANRMALIVKDTGIGIPREFQQKVFDPFQQVDGTITRTRGGTGLGLAITKRIAEMLGGEVSLVSAEGQGSQFTITLPLEVEKLQPEFDHDPALTNGNGSHAGLQAAAPRNQLPEFEKGSELEPLAHTEKG